MNPTVFIRYPETGVYYTRFAVKGKRYLWCTKSDNRRIALMSAKRYRDAIVAKQYGLADGMKSNSACCTFERLLNTWDTLPLVMTKECRARAKASLLRVLAPSGLGIKDRVDRLCRDVALAFQRDKLGYAMGPAKDSDSQKTQGNPPAVSAATITTANSNLRYARIMFSRRAMAFYPDELYLPKERIADFLSVPYVPEKHQSIRPLPDPAAMARAEDPVTGLPRFKPEWCGYLLAKYTGMRPIEIIEARWDWIRDNVIAVGGRDGVATTKTGRFRFVKISPDVVDLLKLAKTDDTYIVGPHRVQTMRRSLSIMLRSYGFDMPDPIYSLRRWHASWRYENQGAPSARDALGHTNESMTMKHYARMINAPDPIPLGGVVVVPAAG